MKNITIYFLVLVSCGIQEINAQTCVTDNLNHSLDRYKNQKHFKPKVTDNVITMRVNINVIQYKAGDERNFLNIPKHRDFIRRVIDSLNNGFSQLKYDSIPMSCVCGTDCHIEDTKIRFEIQNFYFHQDTTFFTELHAPNHIIRFPKDTFRIFNLYFNNGLYTPLGGRSRFPRYGQLDLAQGFAGAGYYKAYLADTAIDTNTGKDNLHYASQRIAGNMQHEIGHSFGLYHLYLGEETLDTNKRDYLWDFFGKKTVSCPQIPTGTNGCSTLSATCVPNWMGGFIGNVLHRELTPMQIGRMHRATKLSSPRKFFKPSDQHASDHEITVNETWDFNIRMYGDIVVKSGATLTVRCKVLMPPKGEIRVEPNGKLIVDGGTITSTEDGTNNWWQGIEVRGDKNSSQYITYSYGYGHGVAIIKNNALIENSAEGAYTRDVNGALADRNGGGVIHATNSTFRNNAYSIRIGKYKDLGIHSNKPYLSSVKGCTFELDSTFFKNMAFFKSSLDLIGIKKIKIDSSTFIYINSPSASYVKTGTGIMLSDVSATIKNCRFENKKYGIVVQSLLGAEAVVIQYNTFVNNEAAARIGKAEHALLQQNYFTKCQTGAVISETKAFKVSENQFFNSDLGIDNRNLGAHSNQLYNNIFSSLHTGIYSNGRTTNSNKGLTFKCNS